MEPHHQLRVSREHVPNVGEALRELGFEVSIETPSWLGPEYPEYADLLVEKDGKRAVFAIRLGEGEAGETVLVYPPLSRHSMIPLVREELERMGARWGILAERWENEPVG